MSFKILSVTSDDDDFDVRRFHAEIGWGKSKHIWLETSYVDCSSS